MRHRMCTLPGVSRCKWPNRTSAVVRAQLSVSECVRVWGRGGGGGAKEGVKGRRTYFTRCRVAFGERLLDLPPLPLLDLPPFS